MAAPRSGNQPDDETEVPRGEPPSPPETQDRDRTRTLRPENIPDAAPGKPRESPAEFPTIKDYTILRKIAEGGQGAVFEALQKSPHRKVAIKVLLASPYASRAAQHRFAREIELVATLRHPNIVAVFDTGQTADGHLYYAMDYVQGTSLTQYVRQHRLPLDKILELCAITCEAVNHAHQKGVMHRDLKPANILVDEDGNLRVLDFGLAKQLSAAPGSLISLTGQIMGTLPYMSPEQAQGNPDQLDIRTDVYALGVILYELLTGAYPYPVIGAMVDVLRHIAETAPAPLTKSWTRGGGVAPATRRRRSRLKCPIDDEVETITLKALSKERERRYQSAGELGRDLRHYLRHEPIEAKRDSGIYLFKRMLARYRVAAGIVLLFMLLLAASSVTFWMLRNEAARQRDLAQAASILATNRLAEVTRERDRADQQARISAAVRDFLQKDILAQAGSEFQIGSGFKADPNLTVKHALDRAAVGIGARFQDQPLVEAEIRITLGGAYTSIDAPSLAIQHLTRARALREALLGADHPDTLDAMHKLASAYIVAYDLARAVPLLEETVARQKEILGPGHPGTLASINSLAVAYTAAGNLAQTVALLEETLATCQEKLGPDHLTTLHVMFNLGSVYVITEQFAKSVSLLEETVARLKGKYGPDHPDTLLVTSNLGTAYCKAGQFTQAVSLLEANMARLKEILGPDHPNTLLSMGALARAYHGAGNLAQAVPLFVETLAQFKAKLGPDHPDTLGVMGDLAEAYHDAGNLEKAVPLLEETLARRKAKLGPDHPDTLYSMNVLALAYNDAGNLAKAVPLLEETLARSKAKLGPDHLTTLRVMSNLALTYNDAG